MEINRWDPNAKIKSKPIVIDENVWLANPTMVLKGVSIGKDSVIGAGTVLHQDVPTNVVVLGSRQQIVKDLNTSVLPYSPDNAII